MIPSITTGAVQELAVRKLEDAGYRATGTRLAVVRAAMESPDGFSADELCDRLPGVGRATVYRTLKLLLQLGVLCKVVLQDGAPRYSLAPFGHHHHVVCVRCGRITDFDQCNLNDLVPRIEAALGKELLGHRLEVYAVCTGCEGQEGSQRESA